MKKINGKTNGKTNEKTNGKDKVVLAYSGGLDTSIIISWLKENYDLDVIACCVDVGQGDDMEAMKKKAYITGASKVYIEDVRDEFVRDFIFPMIKSGAVYEGKYLLGTSIARPVIAKKLIEIARFEGAKYIAHGCTGKGNDQVRFELAVKALAPDISIIAPWRIWDIKSREDAIDYADARDIPLSVTKEKIYSRDSNLWHVSHEGGALEDPWNEPPLDVLQMSIWPEQAPEKPTYLTIDFEKGVPVAVDGKILEPVKIIEMLNDIAGANGVGIMDMVENRLVGMKSRGVYETPAGTVLMNAHKELEYLVLDRMTMEYKSLIAERYSKLLYDGLWFTPLKESLDGFIEKTQEMVTGTVKMKLYKGTATGVGTKSPYSLYSEKYATFGEDDSLYNQKDAEGFINLFGLPLKVRAEMLIEAKQEEECSA